MTIFDISASIAMLGSMTLFAIGLLYFLITEYIDYRKEMKE
jgi:hypothetical protein